MAVVMDEKTVYAFADEAEADAGRALLDEGAVTQAESLARGIGGRVRDGAGADHDVWVAVVGRELTAECDGPCPSPGTLCRHAVALALHAVRRGLPWHAAPAGDTRPTPADILAALTGEEKGALLDRLLTDRPELLSEAAKLAERRLAPRTGAELAALQERTANEVEQALRALDIDDLDTGSPGGYGYISEYEAARRLIEPVIERYEDDVRRRLELGMTDAAEAVGLGVLDGLAACEGDYIGDEVLCYAGEDLADTYGHTIHRLLHQAGRAPE